MCWPEVFALVLCWSSCPHVVLLVSLWQHIDKVFKHKELQQQLMDAKLQRITEMTREVEEKQQRERDFVSPKVFFPHFGYK